MQYPDQIRTEWLYPLKRKMLLGMLGALVLGTTVLGVSLYALLVRDKEAQTRELSQAIESSLVIPMIERHPEMIQSTLENIVPGSESLRSILVLNKTDSVVFSSDESDIGKVFDRYSDPSCQGCHEDANHAPSRRSIVTVSKGTRVHRNVMSIVNRPACYECHDASVRILGKLIVDRSLAETYALMAETIALVFVVGLVCLLIAGCLMSKGTDRYIEKILHQGEELTSLYFMVERLSKTIDRRELNLAVLGVLSDLLKAGEIDLVLPKNGRVGRCLSWSSQTNTLTRKKPDSTPALKSLVDRWLASPAFGPELAAGGTEIIMPIAKADIPLALILLRGLPSPFGPHRLWLLKTISGHIAAAFDNARLYAMAITDELTHLYTRRHFDYCMDRGFSECQAEGKPFSLLMIDIDNFKSVNDTWGHMAGDAVLTAVGACILDTVREGDLAFRYGGEEFAVILPSADMAGGMATGERIRAAVAAISLAHYPLAITISLGLCTWPDHAQTIHDLIAFADKALYAAKHAGKNQLAVSAAGTERDHDSLSDSSDSSDSHSTAV